MEKHEDSLQFSKLNGMHNPFSLKGMNDALRRIAKAVNEREKIVIYGPNNVDGVTAVSLLILVLRYLNADVEYYISDALNENSGINGDVIKNHIKFIGTKLIITVACGINSFEEVELCKKFGMDIIITDNHKCIGKIPDTIVINPGQSGCNYPFKDLTGAGVAFKVVQATAVYYQMKCISKYLDLVMLGTISTGILPIGENKIIVDECIYHLNYTNNYGLRALMKVNHISKIDYNSVEQLTKSIVSETYFKKTDNARITVELFTTSNMDRAEQIAKYLKNELKTNKICAC
ncbi:DHH family phosphoesterase [Clostridium sp. JN-9]|uniref:DHH family phosphoesterase n=1 Tax=Clostridium sp. JN-9 TaxID=2507159 RepID=UPI000FFE0C23|nr:DHH family phosphoesterase [Clostridium sp. JN-9]QAT39501.1 delta(24)-sterol C-methyltransferase [Clostridium sp. JN-9]